MAKKYGMVNDGHVEKARREEIRRERLAAEEKKRKEEEAAAKADKESAEAVEGEQVDDGEFEQQQPEDTSPINADFEVESSEDAEDEEYDEDPDNEYADFNYAGQKAKEEREIKKSRRWVWVFIATATIAACIALSFL